MPGSKLKESLAAILVDEGYISGYQVDDQPGKPGKTLEITMKYSPDRDADHLRDQAGLQARPAHLRPRRPDPEGPRRSRRGGGLDQPRADDRPRGAQRKHIGGEVLCYVW